jgi:2'-5' RNA ligase
MTDLAPSAIKGDTLSYPSSGAVFGIAFPWMASPAASYTDLPRYWSPARDWVLSNTPKKEDMWAAAVAIAATRFAAHGYVIKDSQDSSRKVSASQQLLKRANGGEGWVPFALKIMRDLLTCDNGVFIRIRRQGETTEKIRVKAQTIAGGEVGAFAEAAVSTAKPGAKIDGLYHMDSLRCIRTGNLAYPLRYMPLNGVTQILRWDQVLMYADQPSPRAELFGVGECAASRAYKTIAKLAAMEQLVYENLTGGGANKLVFLQGINDPTLQAILKSGEADAQARGLVYYLGTILGAIPSDTPISMVEVKLKELLSNFVPKDERDNAYLIYANNIGVPVQSIQPLSGQGLGTGTQTLVLDDAAKGQGAMPAFIKWWEQTVSDRVLPATTELQFTDENDQRDQKAKAEVQKLRADTRAVQIQSGEISPAMARQLAVDSEDLPQELVENDATAGGQISDDEKQQPDRGSLSPAALALIQGAPQQAPQKPGLATATKDAGHTGVMVALYPDAAAAKQIAAQNGVTEPIDQLHLTLAFLGDSSETALATNKPKVIAAVKQWAAEKGQPLKGTINGLGRFFHSENDDTNAVFVSPDVPGLPELRQSLVDWIERSGFDYAQNHGFTPHITVAYVPLDAPTPAIRVETPVMFDRVTLAWGDERHDFSLGSGVATKAKEDDDAAALLEAELDSARRLGREARKHG